MNDMGKKDQRISILEDSPLWNGLLVDKEIRYSDFLAFFMETFKSNPFLNTDLNDSNIEIHREKKHTDLWIDEKVIDVLEYVVEEKSNEDAEEKHLIIRFPCFLIENKLKSIPSEEQLVDYTKKFINEYINAVKSLFRYKNTEYKKKGKRINKLDIEKDPSLVTRLSNISELKFYLFAPIKYEDILVEIPKPHLVPIQGSKLSFKWECFTYSAIGNRIKEKVKQERTKKNNNHLQEPKKKYLFDLFEDFGDILNSISLFTDDLSDIKPEEKIIDCFEPRGAFIDFPKMKSLFVKYRASQCADRLSKRISKPISSKNLTKLNNGDIVIHHDYSRTESLFEVKKRIYADLHLIIQYQNKELRKGIVVKTGSANKYKEWFRKEWNGIHFLPQPTKEETIEQENYYKYEVNHELTFYYCKHRCENMSVKAVMDIMQDYADDEDMLNYYSST